MISLIVIHTTKVFKFKSFYATRFTLRVTQLMNIILIGFMGSGKTTVGKALSKEYMRDFLEMDAHILKKTGFKNMSELFDKKGEDFLRQNEAELASEIKNRDGLIVSTGGGVVINSTLMKDLKSNKSKVIFLHSSFDELMKRVEKDKTPRPLFKDRKEAVKLYNFRLPLYKKYADFFIRTNGKTVKEIVHEIQLKIDSIV